MTDAVPTDEQIETAKTALRGVREKGVRWLLDLVGDDGTPKYSDVKNGYYRLPWTLAHVGEREAAALVMSWIERNTLTSEGDLQPGIPRAAWTDNRATYPLALIASGAWALDRYDTALAVMDVIRRDFQDSSSGGIYWERPEARATGIQILFPTAQVGFAAAHTGQRDIADGVFAWFQALYKAQPELPDVLYTSWDADGLRTNPPRDDADALFLQRTDFRVGRQAFYNPGISGAFLSKYHMISGSADARQMAVDLLSLTRNGTPDQFLWQESMQVCKFGWGSAMALEINPSGPHLADVVRMAQWYADSQAADGSWVPSPFLVPNPSGAHATEKTAEHILWVSMMLTALAGRRTESFAGVGAHD